MSLHPGYFLIRFRVDAWIAELHGTTADVWPDAFVVVTAYATTGEQWSAARNGQAHAALRAQLESEGVWYQPITGYDPGTGHAEPGYAVAISLNDGVSLGRAFQ